MDEKSAGHSAKQIDWREHHEAQPYAAGKRSYEDFVPAYRAAEGAFASRAGKRLRKLKTIWRLDIKSTILFRLCLGMKCVRPSSQPGISLAAS